MQSLDFVDIINKIIVRTNETTEKMFQIERRLSYIESNLTSLNQTITLICSKDMPSSPSLSPSPNFYPPASSLVPSSPQSSCSKQDGSLSSPSVVFSISSPLGPDPSTSKLTPAPVSSFAQDAASTLASLAASSSLPSLSSQHSDTKSTISSPTPRPVSAHFVGVSPFKKPIRRQREEVPYSRYPQRAVDILMTWFNDHITDPYPTELIKNKLCQKTGLSKTQVATWFTNARRRRHLKTDAQNGRCFVTFPNVERRELDSDDKKDSTTIITTTSSDLSLQKDSVSNSSPSEEASAPEPSSDVMN